MRFLVSFLFFIFFAPLSLFAQTPTTTSRHAIAMHGEPKHGPDFQHFGYVNPDAPKGGTLKLHDTGTFDSLNPFIVKGKFPEGFTFLGDNLVYESLMTHSLDEPFTMYGMLAQSIEVPEDRSWTAFTIHPEAKWNDGKPVSAHDVVWTFNTVMEKGTPFFKAYYGDVETVEATSDSRVLFTFKHNENAELPLILSQLSILPKHFWEGRVFDETSLEPPLSSGPYRVEKAEAGRSVTYKKVEDWWGKDLNVNRGRYNFERIVVDYYRDDNVAMEAFFSGAYDVREENTAKLWASAYDTPAVKSGEIIRAEIPHKRPQGMQGFIYNTRRPVFADPKVREALMYAFDFEWSNKQFAFGTYTRSPSYFSNSELASSGKLEGRELEILESFRDRLPERIFTEPLTLPKTDGSGNARASLRRGMKILEEAGYVLGKDGIRVHQDTGQKLEFEIIDTNPQFERWVLPLIKNLKRMGVQATFRVIDAAQYQNRLNEFDFDMTIASIGQSDSPGNEQRDFWSSKKADLPGGRNYAGVRDPVVDELIEMIIQAPSREELIYRTQALDRVLLWGFYTIPQWHLGHWRLAWRSRLQRPETLSPLSPAITTTWWSEQ